MYCPKCGNELDDDVLFCPYCRENLKKSPGIAKKSNGLRTAAKVFLVITCVAEILGLLFLSLLYIIPVFIVVPMTIYYFVVTNKGYNVGMVFKILTLLFVNIIAGILMLIDSEE